jgi:hypothetical protein
MDGDARVQSHPARLHGRSDGGLFDQELRVESFRL